MVAYAAEALHIPAILGVAEYLPVASEQFEFVSMGYALRHLALKQSGFSHSKRYVELGILSEYTATKPH